MDLYDQINPISPVEKTSILQDVDFEIELLRRDNINVSYIINLLKDLDPKSSGFEKDIKFIHDLMQTSHELKSKAELIDHFIMENISEASGPVDIDFELPKFFEREKNKEINDMIKAERLEADKTRNIIEEFEYSGKIYDDDIEETFTEEMGLLERVPKVDYLKQKIINLVDKFALI